MTCIVGLVENGTVWIGADSLSVSGCSGTPRPPEIAKVGRRGDMLLAYSGEVRPGQIALHVLEIPEHPDGMETVPYLVSRFVPAFRDTLQAHGFPATWYHEADKGPNWTLVIGYRGMLCAIECDFNVNVSARGYHAYGCGREFALGSLHSTGPGTPEQCRWSPETRVMAALEAAAEIDVYVAPPFVVESV